MPPTPSLAHAVAPRPRVSGIVACFNEEENIGACLASLAWCDEIIVVDSFSTDRTPEIVGEFANARLHQRTYFGDGSQRNWAINQATGDWFFVLDADERCSPALRDEIDRVLRSGPSVNAYAMRRLNLVLGRPLRYSGRRNDTVVRLARRGHAFYSDLRVHAAIQCHGPVALLRERLDHNLVPCFHRYVQKVNLYGYWGAAQAWRDGTVAGLYQLLVRPGFRFVRTYLLQLGLLDGKRGLTFCLLQAYASYLKWSLLWSWRLNAARGVPPPLPAFDEDPAVWAGLRRIRAHVPPERSPAPGRIEAEPRSSSRAAKPETA